MSTKTLWESFEAKSEDVVERVKAIVHEGNVRRVVVKRHRTTIAEFPLTAGVAGAVFAPLLAGVGALVALLKDCTVEVERTDHDDPQSPEQTPAAAQPIDEQC